MTHGERQGRKFQGGGKGTIGRRASRTERKRTSIGATLGNGIVSSALPKPVFADNNGPLLPLLLIPV